MEKGGGVFDWNEMALMKLPKEGRAVPGCWRQGTVRMDGRHQ